MLNFIYRLPGSLTKFVRVFCVKVFASSGSEKLISNVRINFASVVRRLRRARGLPMQL